MQQWTKLNSNSGKAQSKRLLRKERAASLKPEKLSQTSLPFQSQVFFPQSSSTKSQQFSHLSPVLPQNLGTATSRFIEYCKCILQCRSYMCSLQESINKFTWKRQKNDCSTKNAFSASSKWSHSKLLKSKGPLKDKAAWQSLVFSLLPHSLHAEIMFIGLLFSFGYNLDTPVTETSTNWAQRTVLILQAFSNSRV